MSSACALAKAEARAANDSLERCMDALPLQYVEAYGTGFRALSAHAMPDRFPGVLGHQGFELALCSFVIEEGTAGIAKQCRELCPGIRRAHIDDADGLDAQTRRLRIDQVRHLTR